MRPKKLSPDEVQQSLGSLPHWRIADSKLHRVFNFPDFAHAFGFMTVAAFRIEKMDHHPEWLNVYNRVTVDLTTHDAGGITEYDLKLAQALDEIAEKFQ
jgi:4a-hydroxytetrahydrobiopterin dehydratase